MKKLVIELRRRERRRLEKAMRKTRDADFRLRCQVVLNYARGLGCDRVARVLGCAPSTAVAVARRYLAEGISGLYDKRADNGIQKVDDDFRATLAKVLRRGPEAFGWERSTWSRELLALTLAELGHPEVSRTTIARALRALRAKWKSARPTVLCPWSQRKRARRIGQIRRLLGRLPRDEVAFYADEIDIHLNQKIGREWSLPGQQPVVVTPGKNEKRYVAGALNSRTKRLTWVASDRKRSELFIALVDRLVSSYRRSKRIHLVLDNFIIHSSKKTKKALARFGDRVELHFLPPYCPNENKIERFWQTLHKQVTRNHRCRTIGQLMARVTAWLDLPPRLRLAPRKAVDRTRAVAARRPSTNHGL
jgi:transposase